MSSKTISYSSRQSFSAYDMGNDEELGLKLEQANWSKESKKKKIYNIFFLSTSIIIFMFPIVSIMIS